MLGGSWWYGRHTAPKVDAARGIAIDRGREFLKNLPLPAGSTLYSPVKEELSTYRRGPLHGVKTHVTWHAEYNAQGTFEEGLRHFESVAEKRGACALDPAAGVGEASFHSDDRRPGILAVPALPPVFPDASVGLEL